MGAHQIEGGRPRVVHALRDPEAVRDLDHAGMVLGEPGDGRVRPRVVEGHGERADVDRVLAFAAHLVGEHLRVRLAESGRGGELEVPVDVLLIGRLVGDHEDALLAGAGEHRLQHLGIVRHDADRVDALGDEVLDGAHLEGRVGARRADHPGIPAELFRPRLDTDFHGVEPGDPADLDDDPHARRVGDRGGGYDGGGESGASRGKHCPASQQCTFQCFLLKEASIVRVDGASVANRAGRASTTRRLLAGVEPRVVNRERRPRPGPCPSATPRTGLQLIEQSSSPARDQPGEQLHGARMKPWFRRGVRRPAGLRDKAP